MTKRKQRKAFVRWETETRAWAADTGRRLVLTLCSGEQIPVSPYRVGVVLGPDEQAWVECPVRFVQDAPPGGLASTDIVSWPPIRPWLVTSQRIVGRLGDDRLYGYRWEHIVGCRVDLALGREAVAIDLRDGMPLVWTGPGVAPMGVAAVFRLHGRQGLLDHPGLGSLRAPSPKMRGRAPSELTIGDGRYLPLC